MRIAFAGTPDFAHVALQALLDAGFEVALVLTQPDRPSGNAPHATALPSFSHAACGWTADFLTTPRRRAPPWPRLRSTS